MKKIISSMLAIIILLTASIPTYAIESKSLPEYRIIEEVDSEYGKMYYVYDEAKTHQRTLWDVVDILMAGSSWASFFNQPSWGNFGWAVLDTAALLPYLPSSAYFRKGGKLVVESSEIRRLAQTSKGEKIIKAALTTYKYSDGITSKAVKQIEKSFKGKEAKKVLELFEEAANKGIVGATGQEGIKKLKGTYKKKYTHEIKIKNKQYGDYRIFGYQKNSGEWVFELFDRGLH